MNKKELNSLLLDIKNNLDIRELLSRRLELPGDVYEYKKIKKDRKIKNGI